MTLLKNIKTQILLLLIHLTFTVHAITFDTAVLRDKTATNYIGFIGKDPATGNAHEKFVADFNNDGHKDILSLGNALQCVLCGVTTPAAPSFIEMMLYQDGEYVYHDINLTLDTAYTNVVKIVDIDKDGDMDIVVLNGQLLINDGQANFSKIRFSEHNLISEDFFTVDVDQDNDLDIVSKGSFFINDGSLHFNEIENTKAVNALKFTVADLNADKAPDMLVLDSSTDNNQLQSWINDGTGQFQLLSSITVDELITQIHPIDVNADNSQDFILSLQVGNRIDLKMMVNDGEGNLTLSTFNFSQLNDVEHDTMAINKIFSEDADNDGDLDLWVSAVFTKDSSSCHFKQNLLLIYENINDGNLQHQKTLHSSGYDYFFQGSFLSATPTIIDLNQDGLPDVVMTGDNPVTWLQTGEYEFKLSNASSLQFNNRIDAIDFNGDGNTDILSSGMYEQNCASIPINENIMSTTNAHTAHGLLWLGDGNGDFEPYSAFFVGQPNFKGTLEYARFVDLDGEIFVLYTTPSSFQGRLSVLVHPLTGDPLLRIPLPEPTKVVEVADMTNDGTQEIVMLTDNEEASIIVLKKVATSVIELTRLNFGAQYGEIKLADMDNDGNIDIIANSKAQKGAITIWYNNGEGDFTASESFADGVKTIAISDFNGDGTLDIFSSNSNHEIWLNQGNRAFTSVNYDTIFWFEP
ncbi:MAG: VCBS repeat-containing protein, partial [Alcanivoracaceae bacterium]|nr:VCBS repeat-containing protein [Alcanivoracaceae bacterium]